ncbi:MAG: M48 family metalloprotease [Kiloniellales bacterium]
MVLLGACAFNPATGGHSFTAFMSVEDELRIRDQEHPRILARSGGAYDDPALTAYVGELGSRLAAASEMPDLDYQFTILNSPVVNAFALPGGYVYVSRGLLALADSEAELVGVLAHEIGHVTARHAAQRYSRHVLTSFGVDLLDVVSIGSLAETAQAEADDYLQAYTREQELEADRLALRYMRRAGYDTNAMATFLNKLTAYRALEVKLRGLTDAVEEVEFMATHPLTAARLEEVIGLEFETPQKDPKRGREAYLDRIDGLLFGVDPQQGFVRGSAFVHPGIGFLFQVPAGFQLINSPHRVIVRGPEDTLVLFDVGKGRFHGSALRYLTEIWAPAMTLIDIEAIVVNGVEAATGWNRVDTYQGRRDVRLVAIRFEPDRFFRFMFFSRPEASQRLSAPMQRITYSFRRMQPQERDSYRPLRLKLVTAMPGDTQATLAARMPFGNRNVERFAVLNGLEPGATIKEGDRFKIVSW